MRISCLNCVRKHIAQAEILLLESKQGYPEHRWLALGHLAEAEHECQQGWPATADMIRGFRKELEDDPWYVLPTLELLGTITELEKGNVDASSVDQ